jgi:tetrapyrrole methylase family protein/MazG family protein
LAFKRTSGYKGMENSNQPGIVLMGLGPGDPALLTRQAWDWLQQLPQVVVRTSQHPTIAGFPRGVEVVSFDYLYEESEAFEEVYEKIVARVLELGSRPQGVTYAVPGHPFVAEATCPEIARRAREAGIPVKVIEGLSFLEPTYTALEIDPFPHMALVDALELAQYHMPPFSPEQPALIAQIYSREVAADVKLTLNAVYPDTHAVRLVHAAGTSQQLVEDIQLYEIDRSEHIGLLSSLYLPPLADGTSVEEFQEIVAHLRAPDGCPWDREQTRQSIGPYLLEETYEAVSAIEMDDIDGYREELGDLLLVILLAAQIAWEDGDFSFADVVQGINRKIVRRHPHVFGEVQVSDASGVLRNWESIKEAERSEKGKENGRSTQGNFGQLPRALPH